MAPLLSQRNQFPARLIIFAINIPAIQREACELLLLRAFQCTHGVRSGTTEPLLTHCEQGSTILKLPARLG